LFRLGSIDKLQNVDCHIVVEYWGMNELVRNANHLTKISKNLLEVLAIQSLVFLILGSWAQFCEVEALLKIVDWFKIGLFQVCNEGDDGCILKVHDCHGSSNSIPIYEACTLPFILMVYTIEWMYLQSSRQFWVLSVHI
jgi:hypothetical protein